MTEGLPEIYMNLTATIPYAVCGGHHLSHGQPRTLRLLHISACYIPIVINHSFASVSHHHESTLRIPTFPSSLLVVICPWTVLLCVLGRQM